MASMRLLLVGDSAAAVQTLRALEAAGIRPAAVMARAAASAGGTCFWTVANAQGHTLWPVERVKEPSLAETIAAEGIDLLLNVFSLEVIASAVLDALPLGAFNVHPSPLPRYAGLNSVCWALYHGETRYGVTIHRMAPRIDAGPVAWQTLFDAAHEETGLSLTNKCVRAGVQGAVHVVQTAMRDPAGIEQVPQDLSKRSYFGAGVPDEGRLVWTRSARELFNFVRACDFSFFPSPWGHPLACHRDREIAVLKAAVGDEECDAEPGAVVRSGDEGMHIACGQGTLVVQRIQVEGKPAAARDHLRVGRNLF